MTGNFPKRFLGRKTLMGSFRPSWALISVMLVSISGTTSLSEGRLSLRSGLGFPLAASIAHGSGGDEGVDQTAMNRLPSSEKSVTPPWPSGNTTFARGRKVCASSKRTSLRFPASIERASASPLLATAMEEMVATGGFFSTYRAFSFPDSASIARSQACSPPPSVARYTVWPSGENLAAEMCTLPPFG